MYKNWPDMGDGQMSIYDSGEATGVSCSSNLHPNKGLGQKKKNSGDTRVADDWELKYLDPKRIEISPDNPFKYCPGSPENVALEKSIAESGILSYLIARRVDERLILLSGERRLHAALNKGLREVPVLVGKCDDRKAASIMIESNLHREKISESERVKTFCLEMKAYTGDKKGMPQALAHKYGKSIRTIQRYLELATGLPTELIDLIGISLSLKASKCVLEHLKKGDFDESMFIKTVQGCGKLLDPRDVDRLVMSNYDISVLKLDSGKEKEHVVRFTTAEMYSICGKIMSTKEFKEFIVSGFKDH